MKELGTKNWKDVASKMENRSSKQCRERFKNYLADTAKNGPWSLEEEALLEEKYNKYGPRWSMIAGFFNSRSDANVKNHWTKIVTRRKRERLALAKKIEASNDGGNQLDDGIDPFFAFDDEMKKFDSGFNGSQDINYELGDDLFGF